MTREDDKKTRPAAGGGIDPGPELAAVFDDLETLLKNGDVIEALTARGINASLALLAADALRAYLAGRKADAAEDFSTVAEEIRGRLAASAEAQGPDDGSPGEPSRSNGRG
ncbi:MULTISPECIES: hypothetical protein [Sorangium]|uniref:Uncharacterized protein n=1 Tax=Sorangium atrum TaxID=2995308 RepID=A0ABT5CAV1_9BACT|nr:hypothetical protein [Sorangium aterium]MDC0683103.1 hypothetical protein [Sorangium aterium]